MAGGNTLFLKKNKLEDISPLCGATDTPVFELLAMSPLDYKAKVASLIMVILYGNNLIVFVFRFMHHVFGVPV